MDKLVAEVKDSRGNWIGWNAEVCRNRWQSKLKWRAPDEAAPSYNNAAAQTALVKGLTAKNGPKTTSIATFLAAEGYRFTPAETQSFVASANKQLTLKLRKGQRKGPKPNVEATKELLACLTRQRAEVGGSPASSPVSSPAGSAAAKTPPVEQLSLANMWQNSQKDGPPQKKKK